MTRNMISTSEMNEIAHCANDFKYFCDNYVFLKSHHNEIKRFHLYSHQLRLFEHLEKHNNTILSKFRKGGFTTLLVAYSLWKCLFQLDQNVIWVVSNSSHGKEICTDILKKMIDFVPIWMKGNVTKMMNHWEKRFPETGGYIKFISPNDITSTNVSLMIIDEASFINDIKKYWSSLFPMVSGKCVVLSTVRYDDDWFWDMLIDSKLKLNSFSCFKSHYEEHPLYDKEWEKNIKSIIGDIGFNIEYGQIPHEINNDGIKNI